MSIDRKQRRKPGHDEFGRRFERHDRHLVSRNGWNPLNRIQVMRLRRSWPAAPIGIPFPDAAEGEVPEMRGMLLDWEQAVRWIARGWDCIDEYTHELWTRLLLEEAFDLCRSQGVALPASYLRRLAAVDRAFTHVTRDSERCCLMMGHVRIEHGADLYRRQESEYPRRKFWFLYRWQPGAAWCAPASEVAVMNAWRRKLDAFRIGKSRRWRHGAP